MKIKKRRGMTKSFNVLLTAVPGLSAGVCVFAEESEFIDKLKDKSS